MLLAAMFAVARAAAEEATLQPPQPRVDASQPLAKIRRQASAKTRGSHPSWRKSPFARAVPYLAGWAGCTGWSGSACLRRRPKNKAVSDTTALMSGKLVTMRLRVV